MPGGDVGLGIILTIIFITAASDAYAYIDPGTGSLVLQFLIAGVVSSLFVIKRFWGNIKGFFQRDTDQPPSA